MMDGEKPTRWKEIVTMGSTSRVLKLRAKSTLRRRLGAILLIAVIFIVADTMLSWLSGELDGSNAWFQRFMEQINASAEKIASASPEEMEQIFTDLMGNMPSVTSFSKNAFGIVLSVLVSLMSIPLSVGYTNHILRESRGEETHVSSLLFGFQVMWKALVISLLTGLIVGLGSIFLLIPGVIATMMFSLSVMILVDDPSKGPIQCMKESARLMRGHKWRLFKLEFSFFFWYLGANLVTALIGLPLLNIYLTPYLYLTRAEFYKELLPVYRPDPGPEIQF